MKIEYVESRVEQQLTLSAIIANSVDNLTRVGQEQITSQRVHTRLASLKENWEKFTLYHDAITLLMPELSSQERFHIQSHTYFADNVFSKTHEYYLDSVEKMSSFLESEQKTMTTSLSTQSMPQPSSSTSTMFHHARLPRIDIPTFDGSPADWLSFKDLFTSLVVSNSTLTSVEKLQCLKTSLVGSAAFLIKNTALTASNFQKVWDVLISFYENKRLLVNSALDSLINLKRMTRDSANEMEQLYINIMQIYRTLERLQRPIASWDDFLVFIAVERLDSESVKAWEHHLGSSKEPPTWHQFSDFLMTRLLFLKALEKSHTGKTTSNMKDSIKAHYQRKSTNSKSSATSRSCPLCSSIHYVAVCPLYTRKTIQQRLTFLTKHKLCYNCLGTHRASSCHSEKRCQKCGQKHHTTIHKTGKPSTNVPSTNVPSTNVPSTNVLSTNVPIKKSPPQEESVTTTP